MSDLTWPLTEREFEDYEFDRLYSIDFQRCKEILYRVQHVDTDSLRFPLIELAVICYARPFSSNRGRRGKRQLKASIVPSEDRELHKLMLRLRNEAFAHTDREFRDPKVARWPIEAGKAAYPMAFANPDYSGLLRKVADIEALVMKVERVLHARIAAVHARVDAIASSRTPEA